MSNMQLKTSLGRINSLSQDQISQLDAIQYERFIVRLDTFLHEERLLPPANPMDPLADTDRLVGISERIGLSTELGIARYAILASQFGDALQGLSDRSWFSILARHREEEADPDWIERVFQTVTTLLSADNSR